MLQPDTIGDDVRLPRLPLGRIFRQGVLVNVLNPKTALFMFAFLPQFVDPSRGPVPLQIVLLGMVLAGLGLLSDGAYALLAARFGRWLRTSPRFALSQRYVSGGILVGLGVSAGVTNART
jgi:threonine/homoserine/homoserine lactone efflux protein